MTFVILESAALVLTLLIGWEMRRQQMPWQSVIGLSLIVLGVFAATIVGWRGL